ncbi:MAG: ATP synthase F1 subunit gamma [Desulfobacula sp.]|jgi:F-type H+-transporting ATPase subunit gamma|uniref:ATP synthase F1 subunit gamma n=1 Tax=Desulfobacula sp. TaxID=2593537 RepID=UPI001D1C7014|nr:ATP synthase F1 subunit gamma [Desulfobacula sp.]MBT3485926.1 ATP synthase F1 subunit gamma [Desulfobacula sp.]MBT3805428.1 ATP synthase F1 subunit gamma [Desulfobacula sp.]MBT4026003.1 ATP synthase F1 subunit gamma [Desulfobacula sp.]MBT4199078.1 ATP synthase F1 subunit gamma [Desulfobacula sp.]
MATLKEVKSKIVSVKKTKQITSAMKMVATSRLRGAQNSMEAFKPYASKFADVLGSIAGKSGGDASPLLVPRDEVKKVALILCTSDRGLCGGFNTNLISKAEKLIKSEFDDKDVSLICFGKKGRDWAKKQPQPIEDEFIGVVGGTVEFSVASSSGQKMIDSFLEGAVDEVYLIYSKFVNMARQIPTIKQILPIPSLEDVAEEKEVEQDEGFLPEHICEPSSDALLGEMLPKNIFIQIYDALLQTSTSEHAARMSSMENATKACEDIVGELQTIYNKTRQAGITADLMDIVGGAEALKG